MEDKVVTFRPRMVAKEPVREERQTTLYDLKCYPVDIRGAVTFGRLASGLATVGLTVRIDPRSGRVVITDDALEND
jgi:hypothetical protein